MQSAEHRYAENTYNSHTCKTDSNGRRYIAQKTGKIYSRAAVTYYKLIVKRSVTVLNTYKKTAKYRAHKAYGKCKAKQNIVKFNIGTVFNHIVIKQKNIYAAYLPPPKRFI